MKKKILLIILCLGSIILGVFYFLPASTRPLIKDKSLATQAKHKLINNAKPQDQLEKTQIKPSLQEPSIKVPLEEQEYDSERIEKITEQEWKQILFEVQSKLLTKEQLQKVSPGATHHVSPDLLENGRLLGLIRKITKQRQKYQAAGEDFFFQCALNEQSATAVRALCLTYYAQSKKARGQEANLEQFPEEVSKLAKEAISF